MQKNITCFAAKRDENNLKLYLYDDIVGNERDWWTGELIESQTSASTIANMLDENADVESIDVYINSNGGDVKEGLAIYSNLKRHKAKVTVHVDGFACSIASVIAMAGDEVVMSKTSMMMIHHAWMWACGNANELHKAASDLEAIDGTLRTAYLDKAGDKLAGEKLDEMLNAETWLNAESCVEFGLADRIEGEEPAAQANGEKALAKQKEITAQSSLRAKLEKTFNI